MMMELVRYVLVFFVVGWGGGVLGGILFFVLMPLFSVLRGTNAGRIIAAALNGASTCFSVLLAVAACRWTKGEASYAMFALACLAMVANNADRIRRAQSAHAILSLPLDETPTTRAGVLLSERLNMLADLLGFGIGLLLIPRLSLV